MTFRLVALLLLVTLSGCSATGTRDRGHLVIVGGGLGDDNAAVFHRFVSLCADGPIGVIPIASGDGLKAGESSAERWRKYSGPRPVVVIPLTQHDAAKANDRAIARQIASCGGLWFTGGQQDRVIDVLRPGGTATACLDACFAVLNRKNGVIGGTSAGAAIMSDPMITGGRSASAKSRDPDNEDNHHVTTSAGLGFFSFGMTDQHFVQRGRQGRLVDALRDTGIERGFGVSENSALVVDRTTADCEVIGPQAAVWVVHLPATLPNSGKSSPETRVSVLSTGDRVNARTGDVRPAPVLRDVRPVGVSKLLRPVADVWSFTSVSASLRSLCDGVDASCSSYDTLTSLTFESDRLTRVFADGNGRFPCFADVRMKIEPSPQAAPK